MIISFSRFGKHGRLGNNLFQLTSTMGIAERHGAEAAFPEWIYEEFFESPIPHGEMQAKRVEEKRFQYYEWEISGNCDLYGYLQSYKYFGSFRPVLLQSFVESTAKKMEIWNKPVICIQVRRGDYVDNPNYFQLGPVDYLDALCTEFPDWQDCNLLFISDEPEWCRIHFECLPNAHFSTLSDIEDLALAASCDHFIISNSSFGWWCAYLGAKPHSKVVHFGVLHAGQLANLTPEDYYLPEWTHHKIERRKVDLMDLTFLIPMSYDSPDRMRNFELCMKMFEKYFDTNIIVIEQGNTRFQNVKSPAVYARFLGREFHRTRMLNQTAVMAKTPFIAIWDVDIHIAPVQMFVAVEALRNGAQMVIPYDGRFARTRRDDPVTRKIVSALDVGVLQGTVLHGAQPGTKGTGGAYLFNRQAFIEGGMENENFISWGPEDLERENRFFRLLDNVVRVTGQLVHIHHAVGVNSSNRNPRYAKNLQELGRVRDMSDDELRAYIESWQWRKSAIMKIEGDANGQET